MRQDRVDDKVTDSKKEVDQKKDVETEIGLHSEGFIEFSARLDESKRNTGQ